MAQEPTEQTQAADAAVDVEVEDGAASGVETIADAAAANRIAGLEAELATALDKQRHYAAVYDAARREFDAVRARLEREHTRTLENHKAAAVGGLLGVLDSLDQALHSSGTGGLPFIQGVAMIRSQFESALSDLGLQRFDAVGEAFDPERHEALSVLAVAEPEKDNVVLQELRAGARVGEKVVRPAQVVVGRHTPAAAPVAEG